jgi:hypothetical protein
MIYIMDMPLNSGIIDNMKTLRICMIIAAIALLQNSPLLAACNVCHSKNPKMVKMHEALEFKDCFKCHGFSEKKTTAMRKVQMMTDPLCTDCHHRKAD